MTEQGWAGWLPPAAQREIAREDAREAIEERKAREEREQRAEARRSADLELFRLQCEARGQEVSVLDLAAGRVVGRPVAAVFAEHLRAADATDARDAARLSREAGTGKVHVEYVADPQLHYAPARRASIPVAFRGQARRFAARMRAKKALADAEASALIDLPLQEAITLKPRGSW